MTLRHPFDGMIHKKNIGHMGTVIITAVSVAQRKTSKNGQEFQ